MPNAADPFANLPKELSTRHADLLAAMTSKHDPMEWDDEDDFREAHAPAAIARILIPVLHPLLRHRAIAYLWREDMKKLHKIVLGRASTVAGKLKHYSQMDFIIEINFTAWKRLSERERCALMDHELTHCTTAGDDLKPSIVAHDVEEFGSIVKRWGLWQPDLEDFGTIVNEATQMSLSL